MNVNDQWMLNQMQQMAVGMATTLPQTGQNSEPPKTEKGESFQDLMNKAKDKQVDAPQKEDAPAKPEPVQDGKPVQVAKPKKVETVKNEDGTETQVVNLTAREAALVAAGWAWISPVMPDGTVSLNILVGEDGIPASALGLGSEDMLGAAQDQTVLLMNDEWVVVPNEELSATLEQMLQAAGDPRSAEDILGGLEQKLQQVQVEPKAENTEKPEAPEAPEVHTEVKIDSKPAADSRAETGSQDEDDDSGLDAQAMTASQPLFKDVKAAPVKVGENFELDTQQPEMDDKLAQAIRMAADSGLRQMEIKLSPENLGNLTIKLTQSVDGTLQVVLHAANAKAANLLGQHLDNLNAALQGYSQNEVRVEVQHNENSQQADQQQQQQTDPDGRGQQHQRQQEQHQDDSRSGDFIQRLRLGLFGVDE